MCKTFGNPRESNTVAENLIGRMMSSMKATWSLNLSSWLGPEGANALVFEELQGELNLTTAEEPSAAFSDHFARSTRVDDPTEYLNKIVKLSDGTSCLAGIRFLGGDGTKPFVNITALTRRADEVSPRVLSEVLGAWHVFAPETVRIAVLPPVLAMAERKSTDLDSLFFDQVLVGAPHSTILRAAEPATVLDVYVAPADPTDVWKPYIREMALLMREPFWRSVTRPELREDIEDAARAGLVFEARDRHTDEWCGIFALNSSNRFDPRRALRVQDLLVAAKFRGNGLGAFMQRKALQRVSSKGNPIVFGTIAWRDQASWRTALRVGRVPLRAWKWISSQ